MTDRRRVRRLIVRGLAALLAAALALVAGAWVLIQTGWAKDRLRALAVSQANQHLNATLEIGRLEGSLLGGVTLRDVRVVQNGVPIVSIEAVSVRYSLPALFRDGTAIASLTLDRPRIVIARDPDGRWNLAALLRRAETPGTGTGGTPRPLRLEAVRVTGGEIVLGEPIAIGGVHLPTRFAALDAALAFERASGGWRVDVARLSFQGAAPDLALDHFAGSIGRDAGGWDLSRVAVRTPRSDFAVAGRIERAAGPTAVDLHVNATRFAFQEWAGLVPGLRRLAVDAAFEVVLRGPASGLATELVLESSAGDVAGSLVLDATVPGWHAAGVVDVNRLNLAHWLDAPERPSDISGRMTMDLDLDLGGRFPRGTYAFEGRHAGYLEYEAGDVRARGSITADEVLIAEAAATAYGANVRLSSGSIGLDSPLPFRFAGVARGLDLRRLPESVPVPHVESTLTLTFDVSGRFEDPALAGRARFGQSRFLGATVEEGATGTIDTTGAAIAYSGDGALTGVSLERFAADLDIGWLQDPRYAGTLAGRFAVRGAGSDAASMVLRAEGRLERAALFGGAFHDADVSLDIAGGSLDASYDGAFEGIDPSLALAEVQFAAALSGRARATVSVRDLLLRTPLLADYEIAADLSLADSVVRDVAVTAGRLTASLAGGALEVAEAEFAGPGAILSGRGAVALDASRSTRLDYTLTVTDAAALQGAAGAGVTGRGLVTGRATGPPDLVRLEGRASGTDLLAAEISAGAVDVTYTLTVPDGDVDRLQGTVTGRVGAIAGFDQVIDVVEGSVEYEQGRTDVDVRVGVRPGLDGRVRGTADLDARGRRVALMSLAVSMQEHRWLLAAPPGQAPLVSWGESGVTIGLLTFRGDTSGAGVIGVSGTWREDEQTALHVTAHGVALESLADLWGDPASYAGRLELDATLTGTRARPFVTGRVVIVDGRVRDLPYEVLEARVEYIGGMFELGLRLEQSPGVWLTASGAVPLALLDRSQPERPMHVSIASTPVSLGLIEGVTDVVRDVTGRVQLNVSAVGTSHDPRFTGAVTLSDAGFTVAATGARYADGRGTFDLRRDSVTVEAFRIADSAGGVLEVSGTVGTHELRLDDLALDVVARRFEVLRNEFGSVSVDAALAMSGHVEAPSLAGTVTVTSGQLRADRILDRVLFRPYALAAQSATSVLDPLTALNPWERLTLDIQLQVPETLRMIGDNVQVATGTPLGLGNIDVRLSGDLRLRKAPAEALSVTGTLDRMTGRYTFQGRRFDLDPVSSITFRGDLNPELFVTVRRDISGVEARVTIAGSLDDPELRLASTPPLDASDILALIVFNTTTNQLSTAQQEQLAVRAGTLAAGFLASPLVTALERTLGIDILEIEPGAGGARVTIGDEIAPGLVARFSRQFGTDEYDEATIEYYLSRIFRVRATFSDAGSTVRSPFRRVERAGIDLLLFFSF